MPKLKISIVDLRTMYTHSLVIYKNRPVFIREIENTFTFHVFDLTTQRNTVIKIAEYDELKAPARHLGYVNCGGSAMYMSRRPVRRYSVGLSKNSVNFSNPPGHAPQGMDQIRRVVELNAPEIVDTVFNRYPTIDECWEGLAAGVYKLVAFDRQFAMDHRGYIYYKADRVGKVNGKPKSVYDIVFNDEFSHLIVLLDTNYEKDLSTARA